MHGLILCVRKHEVTGLRSGYHYGKVGFMNEYAEYLQQHINDPRRIPGTSVNARHEVLVWEGPTWKPTDGTLAARSDTPCAESGSHVFVANVCADCGLEY